MYLLVSLLVDMLALVLMSLFALMLVYQLVYQLVDVLALMLVYLFALMLVYA